MIYYMHIELYSTRAHTHIHTLKNNATTRDLAKFTLFVLSCVEYIILYEKSYNIIIITSPIFCNYVVSCPRLNRIFIST